MANTPKMFVQAVVPTSMTSVYTVPVGKLGIIKEIILCNTDEVRDALFTMHYVPNGETPSTKSFIYTGDVFAGKETKLEGYSTFVNEGYSIYVQTNLSGTLSMYISGVERDLNPMNPVETNGDASTLQGLSVAGIISQHEGKSPAHGADKIGVSSITNHIDVTDVQTALMQLFASSDALSSSLVATLPAHYSRDVKWVQKSGSNTYLTSPAALAVNIGGKGYVLTSAVDINIGNSASWDSTATDYTVANNRKGKDFYIYACQPSSGMTPVLKVSVNSTIPTGYTASNSRKIGGFHCLCASVGTISGHPLSGYVAGDILPDSVWDLLHRPLSNPEGMVYSDQLNLWIDIYLQSGTGVNTKSVFGGVTTDTRMWNDHVDDLAAVKKKLLDDTEFQIAAEGSNQKTNIAGTADANTTGGHVDTASRRMISNIGLEDCCGFLLQWLRDQSTRWDGTGGWGWRATVGNKGSLHISGDINDVKLFAGGDWSHGAACGSRSRAADSYRWAASAAHGGRGRAEPV